MESNEYLEIEEKIANATSSTANTSPSHAVSKKTSWLDACRTSACSGMLERLLDWSWYLLALLMPLFFLSSTSEYLELNKQALLVVATALIFVLYAARLIAGKRTELKGNIALYGVAAVVGAWIVTTATSKYAYQSLLGIEGQEYISLLSVGCFALLAFIGGTYLTTEKISRLLTALLISSGLASLVGLLQLAGIFVLPVELTKTTAFNTVGILSAWGSLAVVSLVLVVMRLIHISAQSLKERFSKILLPLIAGVNLVVLVALDDNRLWMGLIVGLVVSLAALLTKLPKEKRVGWLAVPSFLIVIGIVMSIVNIRPLFTLPVEAYPAMKTSWEITSKTLQESPMTGYGPGTYMMSYEKFRNKEINEYNVMNFWEARFSQSGSALLTQFAATGAVGILAILALFILIVAKFFAALRRTELSDRYLLLVSLGGAFATLVTFMITKPSDMVLSFVLWLILAALLALTSNSSKVVGDQKSNNNLVLTSFILGLIAIGGFLGLYMFFAQRYTADAAYLGALEQDAKLSALARQGKTVDVKEVDKLIDLLVTASEQSAIAGMANTNYIRSLSQALLYKLNTISADKNTPRDQIEKVANDTTGSAKQATALNPFDGRNHFNLASIYGALIPLDNSPEQEAASLAVNTYKQAIALEPTNPTLHMELGKTYLTMAAAAGQLAQSMALKDEKGVDVPGAQAAQDKLTTNASTAIAQAEKSFKQAIELKKDLAQAYFYLAVINIQNGKKDAAKKNLDLALQYNAALSSLGQSDATLFYSIGLGYNRIESPQGATQAFTFAQQTAGNYPLALWQLILIAQKDGKTADALEIARFLLKSDPENQVIKDKITEIEAAPSAPTTMPAGAPEAVPQGLDTSGSTTTGSESAPSFSMPTETPTAQ